MGGVAHRYVAVDGVAVAAAFALAGDVAGVDEVGEDSLGCAFGDADGFRDVAQAGVASARDAEQDLGVVGDEPPGLVAVDGSSP